VSDSTAETGTIQTNSSTPKNTDNSQPVLPKKLQEQTQTQTVQETPDSGVHPHNAKLSDLNSLAEVGVGIALAFAVIERVRSYFKRYFEKKWTDSHDQSQSVVLDVAPESTNGQQQEVLSEFETIQSNYDKSEERMLQVQKWYSFIVLLTCVIFLSGSPFYSIEISPYWGVFGIILIMSPIILASVYSFILYQWYNYKLSKASKEIESLKETKNKMESLGFEINPKAPSNPTAEQQNS